VADVFISYAREDDDVAGLLAYVIELEGWSCWWDPHLQLGQDFRPVMGEQIDAASAVVVLWSAAARASSWVRWEVERARPQGKLAEVRIAGGDDEAIVSDELLVISKRPHVPPTRDEVIELIARVGHLSRRADSWDAVLQFSRDRPPEKPIIALEFVGAGTERQQCVRREVWTEAVSAPFGTTIGNVWLVGYEGERAAVGWLTVTRPNHNVVLPKRDRRLDSRFKSTSPGLYAFTIPFTSGLSITERMADPVYPRGGIDLDAEADAPGRR
jgi:hypothetical protein